MEMKLGEVQNKRRHEFFKRQDSWTGFKQRIFRVASTVVLPRNRRGSNNVCGVGLKKIKEATSMKSLPPPKIKHDVTVSKSYMRSISAHNEGTRIESPIEEAPAAAEPFLSKRKTFGFQPRTSCIREGDEDYFSIEDSEPQDADGDLKNTFKDQPHFDAVELGMHPRKRPTDLLIQEQPYLESVPFTLRTEDDVLPLSSRVTPKSPVKVVDFSPMESQIRNAKSSNMMLSSSEPFLLQSQERTRLEPSKFEALEVGKELSHISKSIEKTYQPCNSDEEEFSEFEDETSDKEGQLSYKGLYDCMPPPIFMFVITIIEVGIFIYHTRVLINNPKYGRINKYSPAPLESYLIYNPTRRYELWRYLTYAFVHSGYMHIINNIVVQLLLGILLEMVHKWYRVLAIYFAGILAGSLATSIYEPFNYLAGASAGVYALIAAHVSTVILNWSEMERPWIRVLVFLVFVCHDAGTAIYFTYVLGEKTSIGFAAHFGGAVAGLLVGIYVLRNLQWKEWEVVIWYFSIATCVLLFLFAIAWNIVRRDLFP